MNPALTRLRATGHVGAMISRLPFDVPSHLPAAVAAAREALARHGVVVVPTETFYGLAVDPHDETAVARVFAIKGRDAAKALLVVAAAIEQVERLVVLDARRRAALAAAWPAPVTVVLPLRAPLAAAAGTLAVRVPAHTLLRSLLARVGPLTATSANRSGASPCTDPAAVAAALGDEVDLLLDGGATPGGAASTVVDWTGERPVVLRAGAWSAPADWAP
jgi:L-threonylcarbamoyladenylate synthase